MKPGSSSDALSVDSMVIEGDHRRNVEFGVYLARGPRPSGVDNH